MHVPDTRELRHAFVNTSRSRAASASLPGTWPPPGAEDLDFLGWSDPKAPLRAYVVVGPDTLDELVAIELRLPSSPAGRRRESMCDLCHTSEAPDGAVLMVASRAGARGRAGDSVGLYVCSDFACSVRARRLQKAHEKSLTGAPDTRVADLVDRLVGFLDRVRA